MNDHSRIRDLTASALSTAIAEIATLPICTIKTNYQNTSSTSVITTTKSIYQTHGIKGFYNASGWAISSQMISTAAKYTWYQKLNEHINNKFLAGALSGGLASLMSHPIDVIKVHFQMHTPFSPELKKHGPMIFYRGYSKTFSKAIIGSTFFFPLYDTIKERVNNPSLAALGSAIISTTIMQPIDYMKTRHIYNQPYLHINIKPYFKGLSINLVRIVPHFVITMTMIEHFKQLLT